MKWPELLSEDYVLVGLNIKHPKFGVLYVDRIQRKRNDIELLIKNDDDPKVFKYNGEYYTITEIVHFPKDGFVQEGVEYSVAEYYIVYLDWTGY